MFHSFSSFIQPVPFTSVTEHVPPAPKEPTNSKPKRQQTATKKKNDDNTKSNKPRAATSSKERKRNQPFQDTVRGRRSAAVFFMLLLLLVVASGRTERRSITAKSDALAKETRGNNKNAKKPLAQTNPSTVPTGARTGRALAAGCHSSSSPSMSSPLSQIRCCTYYY